MQVLKGLSLKGRSAETDTQVIKGFFIETDS